MVYFVVPRELEAELLEKLTAHYADDPAMTVIVERRSGERRHRSQPRRPRPSAASCATAGAAARSASSPRLHGEAPRYAAA